MITSIILYIFVAVTIVQIIYYLSFSVFSFSSDKEIQKNQNLPVSVIICVKNQANNLQELLPSIINQNYKNFEIVLINNASTDNSLEIIKQFEKETENIKIVDVENNEAFWGNKKYALTLGIKAAKNEYLLFTDTDCKPVSKNWISKMSCHFSDTKNIVLGYSKYNFKKESFLNLCIKFDALLNATQYFSFSRLGIPYMGSQKNIAYSKTTFFKVNGFINHINVVSGENALFIKDAATKTNTSICTNQESFITSKAPGSFKKWYHSKRNHLYSTKHFKFKYRFLLNVFQVSKTLFLLLATLLFFIFDWKIILAIVLIYYIIQFIVVGFSAKKLKEKNIIYFLPFLDIFSVFIHFSIFIANKISKPYWN